jgi:ABC-type transporter Mla MlaB component
MAAAMHLHDGGKDGTMLRITTEKKRGKTILSVEGRLAGPWVAALEQCWRTRAPEEKFSVDLCGVSFIDAAGKVLLKEIHQQGGRLIAEGCLNQAIVQEIEGSAERPGCWGKKKGSHIIFYVAFFSLLVTPAIARAQGAPKQSALPGTAPTGVLRLTLDQAVSLALKQNPTAQIAIINAAETWRELRCCRRST